METRIHSMETSVRANLAEIRREQVFTRKHLETITKVPRPSPLDIYNNPAFDDIKKGEVDDADNLVYDGAADDNLDESLKGEDNKTIAQLLLKQVDQTQVGVSSSKSKKLLVVDKPSRDLVVVEKESSITVPGLRKRRLSKSQSTEEQIRPSEASLSAKVPSMKIADESAKVVSAIVSTDQTSPSAKHVSESVQSQVSPSEKPKSAQKGLKRLKKVADIVPKEKEASEEKSEGADTLQGLDLATQKALFKEAVKMLNEDIGIPLKRLRSMKKETVMKRYNEAVMQKLKEDKARRTQEREEEIVKREEEIRKRKAQEISENVQSSRELALQVANPVSESSVTANQLVNLESSKKQKQDRTVKLFSSDKISDLHTTVKIHSLVHSSFDPEFPEGPDAKRMLQYQRAERLMLNLKRLKVKVTKDLEIVIPKDVNARNVIVFWEYISARNKFQVTRANGASGFVTDPINFKNFTGADIEDLNKIGCFDNSQTGMGMTAERIVRESFDKNQKKGLMLQTISAQPKVMPITIVGSNVEKNIKFHLDNQGIDVSLPQGEVPRRGTVVKALRSEDPLGMYFHTGVKMRFIRMKDLCLVPVECLKDMQRQLILENDTSYKFSEQIQMNIKQKTSDEVKKEQELWLKKIKK